MMTISVPTVDDSEQESEERFTVTLSNPSGAGLNDDTGEGTITDNDGGPTMPELSIGNALVQEGETAEFEVRLIPAATQTVTVDYATAGDTAVEDSDYRATMGTLTFMAGETMMTISVPTIDDGEQEPEERFRVTLSSPSGATLNDDTGEGTITDNDDGGDGGGGGGGDGGGGWRRRWRRWRRWRRLIPVVLSIGDASVEEGGTAEFLVRLSLVVGVAVTVDFETVDGTAEAGSDYTAASGTLTFTVGETTETISVPTLDDTVPEVEEGFTVVLSNPSGAGLEDATGEGTITDDDVPALAIDDAPAVVEGGTAEFVVRLSEASSLAVMVDFETVDGTAEAGSDYRAASGRLTFAAGETTRTILVPTVDDTVPEAEEDFTVVLSNPLGARMDDDTGEGTIRDNELPELSIGNALVEEGETAEFEVRLSPAGAQTVTVDYATADDTAVAGADYTSESGTLTFTAGQTMMTIPVPTVDDSEQESEERFTVTLSNPLGAGLNDDTGEGTITDNDGGPTMPELSIGNALVEEGETAEFEVRLIPAATQTVTVAYATAGDTAVEDSDYRATMGTLTFTAGQTMMTISVPTVDDSEQESEERFTVTLSNPAGARLNDDTGEGTIIDNDQPLELAIDDAPPVVEGGTAEFVVRLSAVSGVAVTVDFETADGTAKAGDDYTSRSGTLTFTAGQLVQTISVPTLDDTVPELEEGFTVVLSNPSGARLNGDTGEGTIIDNDQPLELAIDDAPPVVEGGTAEFVVRLSAVSGVAVTVDFETVDGTAKAGSDYTAASGTLTFTAGQLVQTISVPTLDDTVPELEEGFTVVLSNPSGARLEDDTGEGTITDNDQPLELAIDDAPPVVEGGTAEFVVRLSAVSGVAVTVDFETADGTAVAGDDYTSDRGH